MFTAIVDRVRLTVRRLAVVLAGLLLVAPALGISGAAVESVRLWRAPDNTRLVFDLDGPVQHTVFMLENPLRLVIDVDETTVATPADQLPLDNTPIAGVRFGVRDGDGLRVVLDLKQQVKPRSFTLLPNDSYGHRLVVDLFDELESRATTIDQLASENRDIIIAIDAGHGGEDPGALGPGGLREKDIVLSIAKRLEKLIDAEPGYRAELVRTGDYYIPLRNRSEAARSMRADLFLSIHADAFTNPKATGASVFALSDRGATSETARVLASKENQSDLIGGVGDLSLRDKDDTLASVLLDLSMSATMETSLRVGTEVLSDLGNVARLHKPRVEQAGFMVLKSPDVPSLLIETGFISNPIEARNLSTAAYQDKLANAVFAGVRRYFESRPPAGTLVATQMANGGNRTHVIRSGESLSLIAQRYNVSLDSLRAANNIQGSLIKVGQRLRIPAS